MKTASKLLAIGLLSFMLPLVSKAAVNFRFDCPETALEKGATTTCTISGDVQTAGEDISKVTIEVKKNTLSGLTVESFTANSSVWTTDKNDATALSYEVSPKGTITSTFDLGSIVVKMLDDVTTCGEICIKVTYVENGSPLTSNLTGDYDISKTSTASPNCEEIPVTSTSQPPTGSFVNYLVLFGSTGIAILAIAITRKSTKFYRV